MTIPTVVRRAAAIFACLALTAQAPVPPPVSTGDILEATLHNGLRVVIIRNAIAPAVSTEMTYLVGSRDDPPDYPGLAHAQEHLMFRGTHALSTSELGTIATALGGEFNASTSETTTQYQFTVPNNDIDAVFRIESDRMRGALDLQSQWQNERGAIEQEVLRDDSEPGNDFFRSVQSLAFAGTTYAHDGVGTRASFDRLTGPRAKVFYDRWYAPNNAVFVVAGNIDPAQTLAQIRARFEAIPPHPIPPHVVGHLQPVQRTVIRRPTSLIYPLAAVAFRMPGVNSPDFLPSFVLQGILSSERGPLRALVDSGETLSGSWDSLPYVPEGQVGVASAALRPGGDPAAIVARIEHILTTYAQTGVPRELFETTKHQQIVGQDESRNSIAALASDWSTTIALDREPSIAREQQLIAAVTLADVNRVARRYLNTSHAIIGELTPSVNASQSAAPAPASQGPENPLGAQPPVTALPTWGEALLRSVAAPPAPTPPTETTLSNGIRLIVQPETISDSVFVFGAVRSNAALEEPPGKEGIASVLDAMFDEGTRTRDRIAFQRAQDDADTQISAGANFELQTTSTSFDRAIALLGENELQPRFDEATFERARRRAIDELQTALNGSQTVATRRAMAVLLPFGDPELREPSATAMQSLTLGDVTAYDAKIMRPDLTTIVVVGNVTPAAAQRAIERSFGAWQATGAKPDVELPALPLNPSGDVGLTLPINQESVTLEQIVALARTAPAAYPLTVGNAILGGGSLGPDQSRLFRDLRQNAGLVYSVASQLQPRRKQFQFALDFASSPANVPRIESAIDREIERMKTQPVGAFELALAKASLVRRSIVGDAAVTAIGESLLRDAENGTPFDQDRIDDQQIIAVTADAVQSAFATYIDPQHFVKITIGP